MRATRWPEGGLLIALTLLLFLYPAESAAGARQGLVLCRDLLIPALFPFFVLSSLLIATGTVGRLVRPLTVVTRPLLGIGEAGTAALLLGLVGGYPVGLRTLAELKQREECRDREARRTALLCNSCGPAFFLGAAGTGVFGSRQAGVLLLCANVSALLLLGLALRVIWGSAEDGERYVRQDYTPLSELLPDCVRGSFSSVLGVCGYVILFSVLSSLADCTGLLMLCQQMLEPLFPGPDGETLTKSLSVGLLEISTGTAVLRDARSAEAALPLAAFLLGWGGLSVHGQSLPFLRQAGGRARAYLTAKLVHGLLAAGVTVILPRLFPLSLPAMASGSVFPAPGLPGREITALWLLAGAYFFLSRKKRVEKTGKP